MPKYNLDDEAVIDVVAEGKSEVNPDNVFTLSSGIRVKFIKRLDAFTAQQIVVLSFNNINMDSSGRVRNNMSSQEQLATAKKMYDFNSSLILNGLVQGCLELYDEVPNDKWLKAMKINPAINSNHPDIDWKDPLHVEFLYLFYKGFVNEDDYALLSKHLLGD